MRTATITFRGEEREVVIHEVVTEPDVNAYSIEWSFAGDTGGLEQIALAVTEAEEEDILNQLWRHFDEMDD